MRQTKSRIAWRPEASRRRFLGTGLATTTAYEYEPDTGWLKKLTTHRVCVGRGAGHLALQMHFSRYVAELLGDASSELRRNFVRRFDWRQQVGGTVTEAKQT